MKTTLTESELRRLQIELSSQLQTANQSIRSSICLAYELGRNLAQLEEKGRTSK